MPSITFDQFDVGLDRRKSASTSEAGRLRVLQNAFVTTGKVIRKRPPLELVAELEAGTVGLVSGLGVLNTFQQFGGGVSHADARFVARTIDHTAGAAYGSALSQITAAEIFNGTIYIAAKFADAAIFHHYLDGASPTRVTDASCPHGAALMKAASRIMSPSSAGTVRYCKLEAPRDWSTAGVAGEGAGYLPTGITAKGADVTHALGQYDGKLAAFFVDALQLWTVDQDDRNNSYYKTVEGLGTRYRNSPVVFASDLLFLAESGFRSVSTQSYSTNLIDNDIGSPIDSLVLPDLVGAPEVLALYLPGTNQYWGLYTSPGLTETTVWVLSYSKSAKVSAWSKYVLPFVVDAATSHEGALYLRSGDNVYRLNSATPTSYMDGSTAYEMRVEFPFLDFKTPGIEKYIMSMDLVVTGEVELQFRYDPNDETKITDPITISGNTRGLATIPIEATLPAIAPVFTSSSESEVQIDAMTFYYDLLGPQG